jgi:hypothetical protein
MIPCRIKESILLFVALSVLVAMLPRPAKACGPFFTDAIFVFEKHPEFPLERFARGQLGVLEPSYARSYLVAAYRNLSGEPLNDAEVDGLKALWEERINLSYDYSSDDWIKKWTDARAKVPGLGAPPEINVYRNREKPNDYETFLNCQQDAFDAATATLNDRIGRFGADNPVVRDWATTQDIVFSNCGGGEHIPPPATDADEVLRRAHVYQTAAANFYATKFDEAAGLFDAIAKDASSPWHLIAPYLAARSMLRKGSLAEKDEQGKPALADAEKRLSSIIKNQELRRSHHAAERLLNLTRLRLHPEETVDALAASIGKRGAAADFKQAVWDYTVLLDKYVGEEEVKSSDVPESIKRNDLTDWVLTFQDQSPQATEHAIDKWVKTQRVPWLVAAIAKADITSGNINDLINAAAELDHTSPAFAPVVLHHARLVAEMNRADEARTLLDRTLAAETKTWPRSAVNRLLSGRLTLSMNLADFLRAAQREPAGFSDNDDGREVPVEEKEVAEMTKGVKLFFDTDASNVFNKLMPVAVMDEAAGSSILPQNLRRDVAQAAFMRAALLDRAVTANQAATKLANLYPELRELLTDYRGAKTPDARRFAAALLALRFPGLRPFVTAGIGRQTDVGEVDSYRDNWWCEAPPGMFGGTPESEETNSSKPEPAVPEFLKNRQTEAENEFAALRALGTAPNYLAQTVINFATKNPADQRVPEALHLAVKSTRFGCTDKDTGRWSKAAFDLLHRKYANTSWAKETKYWFKG